MVVNRVAVQDRRQWHRRGQDAGLRAGRRRAHRDHAAVPDRLFEDLREATLAAVVIAALVEVGTVQHAFDAHGTWRTSVTAHGEPVVVVVRKRPW
jgi:hypothetical protein